jgi:hypothetical protein
VTPRTRKLRIARPRIAAKAVAKTARKPRARPRPAAIDKARAEVMAQIEHRGAAGDEGKVFLDKARLLLTRHWTKADWAARARLLKSAGWLIRVAATSAPPRAAARALEKASAER